LEWEPLVIKVTPKVAKKYTYYVGNQLTLKDVRGYNLIAPGAVLKDEANEIEYGVQSWVKGDGNNGFANGIEVTDPNIYGLQTINFTLADGSTLPQELVADGTIDFDAAGKLVFNNKNQIELTSPIKFQVLVTVSYLWDVKTVVVPVTIYNSSVIE
jgi:hypothetical protein